MRYDQKRVVFIFGCQRSGTTLLSSLLGQLNKRAYSFPEVGELCDPGCHEGLRLRPRREVERSFRERPEPVVFLKPLVESHRAVELLQEYPNSTAIWVYRDWRDSASSYSREWGDQNAKEDVHRVYDGYDWRGEGISVYTRDVLRSLMNTAKQMTDWPAVWWWCRNRLLWDSGLYKHFPLFIRYADLVQQPVRTLKALLSILGFENTTVPDVSKVHSASIGIGHNWKTSFMTQMRCQALFHELQLEQRSSPLCFKNSSAF